MSKPVTLKIVATEGGFAVYEVNVSMNPAAVFRTEFEVLDWVAERLARLAYPETPRKVPGQRA